MKNEDSTSLERITRGLAVMLPNPVQTCLIYEAGFSSSLNQPTITH